MTPRKTPVGAALSLGTKFFPWWERQKRFHGRPLPARRRPADSLAVLRDYWSQPWSLAQGCAFLLLVLVFLFQASVYWHVVIDDAYITFRYVDMFVKGHGWSFNPGEAPVEGFTNFLWALLLVIPHALGWDLMALSKVMGLASGIATMAVSWGLARAIRGRDDFFNLIPPAVLATNAHFAHWALMGMETLLQCALVTATYYRFVKEGRDRRLWVLSPMLAVLAVMARLDSLLYLMPLAVYGWWLVLWRRMPLKQLLLWAAIAGGALGVYNGWRVAYFGDWLPNTYYAKQRNVLFEGRGRAVRQFQSFYFNQAGFEMRRPLRPEDPSGRSFHARMDRLAWNAGLGSWNPVVWMNFWAVSLTLCLFMGGSALLIGKRHAGRWRLLYRAPLPAAVCVLLLPWGLNFYYVYHVNGDWMPGFRFVMMALPFIGVAGAAGFGWLGQLAEAADWQPARTRIVNAAAGVLAGWMILATASGQLRTNTVYIFSSDDETWFERELGWARPSQIMRNYRRGFVPPLDEISNFLLLNTQDDASIFMSDIGQPMWYGEHLRLYDVDGLTNPYLGHAPSVRGELPSVEEHYRNLLAWQEVTEEELSPEQRKRFWQAAREEDFHTQARRNARLVMEEWRPEYLLLFINHVGGDPDASGWAYPHVSRYVSQHPGMEDYQDIHRIRKIQNAWNHVYRRTDVPHEVPHRVQLDRMYRAVERNPRMPATVLRLYRLSREVQDLSSEDADRISRKVAHVLLRFPADPVVLDLAYAARDSGDRNLEQLAIRAAMEAHPGNPYNYLALANIHIANGAYGEAIEMLEQGIAFTPLRDNTLHYRMTWLLEHTGRDAMALYYAREATERNPQDARAWSDLGSLLDRRAESPGYTPEERREMRREALTAFRTLRELLTTPSGHIPDTIARLEHLTEEMGTPPAAPPPPAPATETRYVPPPPPIMETRY